MKPVPLSTVTGWRGRWCRGREVDDAAVVTAFGTIGAGALSEESRRSPERAALFYATDDSAAGTTIERLITAAGFDPVSVGGLDQAVRIEMFGDPHQNGGPGGRILTAAQARRVVTQSIA